MTKTTKRDAYEIITNRIIAALEAGTVPWHKPWKGGEAGQPKNLLTQKSYRGVNVWTLAFEQTTGGYASPYWLTYRQAQQLGGHVRKGETGVPVVFWNFVEREDKETKQKKKIPFLRLYTVFNLDQVDADGEGKLSKFKELATKTSEPDASFDPIKSAELIAARYLDDKGPEVQHAGSRACYRPSTDTIRMPGQGSFTSPDEYYSTLFHEMAHSTGHGDRLKRPGITDGGLFGSHTYSKEELVAEFAAAFLCGEAGIESTFDNSASYIDGWLTRLKKDKRLLIQAAAAAQKATDHVLAQAPAATAIAA